MKTLIELYDSNLILNICTAIYLKPENVVFVCGKAKSEKNRNIMTEMLSRHCPDTQVHFYKADSSDTSDIIECLEEITERFPDCAIEINGGNNTEIFAAGVFTATQKLPVFSYNPRTGKAVFVDGYIELPGRNSFPKLSIDDFAHMAGGKYSSHGHFDIEKLKPETMIVADRVWRLFFKRRFEWHTAVNWFQNAFRGEEQQYEKLCYELPLKLNNVQPDISLISELSKTGIFKRFVLSDDKAIFEIRNIYLKKMLCDYGVWLELYVYNEALRSGAFDSADMSVVFEWKRDEAPHNNVTNEIDVVLIKGCVPYFISCKAGTVATSALNEIKTISGKFGSGIAKPVLVTTCELSSEAPKLYKRAVEMGVRIIEASELESGRLVEEILK